MSFKYTLWVNNDKLWPSHMQFGWTVTIQNKKDINQDIIHFENAIYRVIHERSNITASFAGYLKFRE